MKEKERRQTRANQDKTPTANTMSQPETPPAGVSLQSDAHRLQSKVGCRQPIPCPGWQRNHRFMHQPRNKKNDDQCGGSAETRGQRPEHQITRDRVEGRVPSPTPKVRQRSGSKRATHQRRCIDSRPSPRQGQELKQSEVEEKHDPNHCNPPTRQRLDSLPVARGHPNRNGAAKNTSCST